jgi:hypothetical protein
MEELYGILEKAHKETGHGGRDRMIKHLNNGYANISRESIELFTSLCALGGLWASCEPLLTLAT